MTTNNNNPALKRDIGMMAAGFLVLNGIIGAGIFGLPGRLAEVAGDFSPWLFLIFGVLILSVVWSFAALASYFSSTGGPVVYVTNAFGPVLGFQTGWLFYVGRVAAFAANLNLLFDYAAYHLGWRIPRNDQKYNDFCNHCNSCRCQYYGC